MADTLLWVKDLKVMRGEILVLRNINLHVKEGEVIALIGPNGAGKTTLLGSIMGLHRIVNGIIRFGGEQIQAMKAGKISNRISLVPQEFATFPFLTVLENFWVAKGSSKREIVRDEIFNLFPVLCGKINQEACTLSGGERQMLALGMGVIRNNKLLLLDEPTLGLAPMMVNRILNTIKEISKSHGVSILISEQTPRVLDISDRVYVIEGGQIRMEGEAEKLKTDERIIKVYLGMAV